MSKYISVLLALVVFPAFVLGQDLDEDLKKSFYKYKVVKINNQEALRKAKLKIPFTIRPNNRDFQFILKENDLRSEDYHAEYTDNSGRHSLPRGNVFTY